MGKGLASSKEAARRRAGKPSAFASTQIKSIKHVLLGQRKRGYARSTLQVRSRGREIRRATLLVEHQQQGRTNVFIDSRFGEGDDSLPHEDAQIARFQCERQRQACTSKFALAKEEVTTNSWELTHGGRALGEMEDGELADEADLGVDEPHEEAERLSGGFGSSHFIKAVHFGGGELAEKTAKEALNEAIARHKLARLDRKELRRQELSLVDELDADFDQTRRLIFATSNAVQAPSGATPALAKRQLDYHGGEAQTVGAHSDFETTMWMLSREMRTQPSVRLLNDAERVVAEQQRLRSLEAERLYRMQACAEQKGGRRPTDEDLADDPVMEVSPQLVLQDGKLQLQGDGTRPFSAAEGEEGKGEEGEEGKVGEGSEEGGGGEGSQKEDNEEDNEAGKEFDAADPEEEGLGPSDLPFVFPCPVSSEELDKLLALAKGSVRTIAPRPPPPIPPSILPRPPFLPRRLSLPLPFASPPLPSSPYCSAHTHDTHAFHVFHTFHTSHTVRNHVKMLFSLISG